MSAEEFDRTFLALQKTISGEECRNRAVEPARDKANLREQPDAPAARRFVIPNEITALTQPQQR